VAKTNDRMTPLCVTCMYDRPLVSDLFLTNMERLGIPVLAAVSDRASMNVCEGRAESFLYFNQPLGRKWNAVIERSLSYDNWTHLIISGDDDLYSANYLTMIDEYQDLPYIGLGSLYMIDPFDYMALHFKYEYPVPVAIGSGKVLQRKAVEKSVELFDSELRKGLDTYVDLKLLENGYSPIIIDRDNTMMVSVKTRNNIWPLRNFIDIADEVDFNEAMAFLSDDEKFKIQNIRNKKTVKW